MMAGRSPVRGAARRAPEGAGDGCRTIVHHDAWLLGYGLMLLLAGAAAALIVFLVGLARRPPQPPPAPAQPQPFAAGTPPLSTAEQILSDRLARGEIDVTDFDDRMAALRRHVPPDLPRP